MDNLESEDNHKMNLSSLLEKIFHTEYNFCGLCYKSLGQEESNLDDEVILQENNIQKTLKISDVLFYVLGEEVFCDISVFPSLCFQCVTSAVTSYKFMREAKENLRYLITAIENLTENFAIQPLPVNFDLCDTVFVTLNPEDLSVGPQYYDNVGPIQNRYEAFKIFCNTALGTQAIKKEVIDKKPDTQKFMIPKQPKKKDTKISTLDMVLNGDMNNLLCKECLKEFTSITNLRNHFLRVHAPKKFKCSICLKCFGTKSFLKAHQAESHVEIVCSECGNSFKNMQRYKTHIREHCKRIVCPDCGRTYKNHNTYKRHLQNDVCQTAVRHSPADAKFTCDYCNKKYTQKISLRVHIQYEHLNYKYLECKWCQKKFWCQARLKAHIVKHTKEKNFLCKTCGGKFVTKESLLYHTRIHTGERPYPCQYCDSRFLSASRRIAHVRSQHMDPTVECEICHSKFKSLHFLLKHKQKHSQTYQSNPLQNINNRNDENFIAESHKNRKDNLVEAVDDIVYNIVETGNNVFEMQSNFNDGQKPVGKVEFILLNENNESQQSTAENERIYLEIPEDGEFVIKEVLENVEV